MREWRIDIESDPLEVDERDWRDRLEVFIEHLEADARVQGAIAAGQIGHLGAVYIVEAEDAWEASVAAAPPFRDALIAAAGDLKVGVLTFELEPADYEPMQPVGATEAARILGVTRQRFYQLQDLYEDFPVPIATPARGALWDQRAIAAWNQKERKVGRPQTIEVPMIDMSLEVFPPEVAGTKVERPLARSSGRGRQKAAYRKRAKGR